jgi:hypothetical protein
MGLLFIEGFDYTDAAMESAYTFNDSRKTLFYNNVTFNKIGTNYARYPGGCGLYAGHYAYCYNGHTLAGGAISTCYTGFALKLNGTPDAHSTYPFIAFFNGADVHAKFHLTTTGQIRSYGSGGLLDTSEVVLNVGAWHFIEIKVYCHTSAGTIDIKVDGKLITSLTSIDTQDNATEILKVRFGGIYQTTAYLDDWYIADDKFYGDSRIYTIRPDSDETHSDFTPLSGSNYENVDDAKIDNDSSYNESSQQGDKDSFGVTLPAVVGDIHGVQLTNSLRKEGGATAKVKNLIRSNSTDYPDAIENTLAVSYASFVSMHLTDPDDSNPWTKAKIEAAEFGVEVTALSTTTTT